MFILYFCSLESVVKLCLYYIFCSLESVARLCLYFIFVVWSQWSGYDACSVTCGAGVMTRTRTCRNGNNCPGPASQTQSCNAGQCPSKL